MKATLSSGQSVLGVVEVADFPNGPQAIRWGNRIFTADITGFGQSFTEVSALVITDKNVGPAPKPDSGVAYTAGDMRRILGDTKFDDEHLDIWVNQTGHYLAAPAMGQAMFSVYADNGSIPKDQHRVATKGDIRAQLAGVADAVPIVVLVDGVKSVMIHDQELGSDFSFEVVPAGN